MANIHDVATRAGVAISTVSAVINESGPVSEETRRRVWEAIDAVGYTPNGVARSLRLGRSRLIGLVVSEITNPFFASITRAIEDAALALGYAVIICNTDEDPKRELELFEVLRVQRVAGIVLAPSGQGRSYRADLERGTPVPLVTIDRHVAGLDRDFVGLDNHAAGRMITEYLLRLGHRRIAFIGGRSGLSTADDRFRGFRDALAGVGQEFDSSICVRADFRGEAAYSAAQALLTRSDRPTAIVAANNVMALGTLQAAADLGFECPADISVAGIDDFPWSAALRPRLTTVAQPIEMIGRKAVEWLFERILKPSSRHASREMKFAPTLLIRESCAPV